MPQRYVVRRGGSARRGPRGRRARYAAHAAPAAARQCRREHCRRRVCKRPQSEAARLSATDNIGGTRPLGTVDGVAVLRVTVPSARGGATGGIEVSERAIEALAKVSMQSFA